MTTQLHAPPTETEYADSHTWGSGKTRESEGRGPQSWSTEGGWCSACRAKNVLVAHMGNADRNFAICGDCLKELAAEIDLEVRPVPPNGEGQKP